MSRCRGVKPGSLMSYAVNEQAVGDGSLARRMAA